MSIVPVVSVSSQPLDQSVSVGGTATFNVISTMSDDGVVYYQWATNNPRIAGLITPNIPGLNGISSGSTVGAGAFQVGAQYESAYPISFFLVRSGYAQPGGLIFGATSSSFTTPVLLAGDNGSRFSCYVIQIRTIAQSVGNLPNFQFGSPNPAPFTKPMQLFSVVTSRAAILTVH